MGITSIRRSHPAYQNRSLTNAAKHRKLNATIAANRARWSDVVFVVNDAGDVTLEPRVDLKPPPRGHVIVRLADLGIEPQLMRVSG